MLEIDEQTQTIGGVRLQTLQRSYAQILAGDDPWFPLGKFMHQYFGAYRDYRSDLLRDPIEVPEDKTAEQWRWAVWIAASADYLCRSRGGECPAWALDDRFKLAEPWYYAEIEGPEEEAELREETPPEFARRNIYCEAEPYRNKYEFQGRRSA